MNKMKICGRNLRSIFIVAFIIAIVMSTVPMPAYAVEKTGEQMVADVIKELDLANESYYNKIYLCSEWISDNITYDFAGLANGTENRSTKDTMVARTGVCTGYANVFKTFMDQIGVPCLVLGDGRMIHDYNMVLMNDYQWYIVEPQAKMSVDYDLPLLEERVRDTKERIRRYESWIGQPGFSEREQRYNIAEAEKEIKELEEQLAKTTGQGNLNISNRALLFLDGSDEVNKRGEYYEFAKLTGTLVYGYPVATESLKVDPDMNQKEFISKSSASFTNSSIIINAATSKANAETGQIENVFPLEAKNYDVSDLKLEFSNLADYNLNGNRGSSEHINYTDILDGYPSSRVYQNLRITGHTGISAMSFQVTAETIYGDKSAPAIITVKFPQLTKTVSSAFANGLKVGQRVKLSFTDGATLNDFDVVLDHVDKATAKCVEYDSNTGEIIAKVNTTSIYLPTLWITSKTNKAYTLGYSISVGAPLDPYTPSTTPAPAALATPTPAKVLVDGEELEFDAYVINNNNYFKLRDVAQIVSGSDKQFEVTWNGTKSAIELFSGKSYTTTGGELVRGDAITKVASAGTSTIYKDGSLVNLTAYAIGGNNYFKLRDLGQTFDFNVSWDAANNAVIIDTTAGYTTD